jgi:hypothetical protein
VGHLARDFKQNVKWVIVRWGIRQSTERIIRQDIRLVGSLHLAGTAGGDHNPHTLLSTALPATFFVAALLLWVLLVLLLVKLLLLFVMLLLMPFLGLQLLMQLLPLMLLVL